MTYRPYINRLFAGILFAFIAMVLMTVFTVIYAETVGRLAENVPLLVLILIAYFVISAYIIGWVVLGLGKWFGGR